MLKRTRWLAVAMVALGFAQPAMAEQSTTKLNYYAGPNPVCISDCNQKDCCSTPEPL